MKVTYRAKKAKLCTHTKQGRVWQKFVQMYSGSRLMGSKLILSDGKMERQIDRKKERQKDRKTERQKDRKTERQKERNRKTERQKDRKTERQK
jgi:hypothetical protein